MKFFLYRLQIYIEEDNQLTKGVHFNPMARHKSCHGFQIPCLAQIPPEFRFLLCNSAS